MRRTPGIIFGTFGFPVPQAIGAHMVTDNLPDEKGRYRKAPSVVMTPRLSKALDKLTKYDRILYDLAAREFDRRETLATQPKEQQF